MNKIPHPAKSAAEIRAVLRSIHDRNEPKPAGPYVDGLPTAERKAVHLIARRILVSVRQHAQVRMQPKHAIHDAEYYRRLLQFCSTRVGAVAGALLGANFSFVVSMIVGSIALLPLWTVVGAGLGCVFGISVARSIVFQRRADLFGQVVSGMALATGPNSASNCRAGG